MITKSLRYTALVIIVAMTGACGGQGPADGAQAVDEDSPEYQAYQYRHGLMHVIAFKVGVLRGMAEGEIPVNDAVFTKHAGDLAALGDMIVEGFPQGSGNIQGTRAMPDIWSNWSDFQQKARDLQAAASSLASAAQSGGFAAAQGALRQLGESCGGCHRPYRSE